MGFFDDLKGAFENEPKVQKTSDATASGKTRGKETPAYIKKKEAERRRIELENQKRVDAKKENKDGGWTWK